MEHKTQKQEYFCKESNPESLEEKFFHIEMLTFLNSNKF